jgi:8-oxo-dGTP pyrophosphatase MutT (NUDIX family)
MNLFINDKPVKFIQTDKYLDLANQYSSVVDGKLTAVKAPLLKGHVLVVEPTVVLLYKLFTLMRVKKLKKLQSITFATANKRELVKAVKKHFKIIKAAGGIVSKDNRILLMYRLKKWDLPKGKLDKDEKSKIGALREVEEECNVKVKLDHKVCSTWHTYTQNGNRIMKKTKWYAMTCLDDTAMKPQLEEDIEQLIWVDPEQAKILLADSYKSINYVVDKYFKRLKTLQERDNNQAGWL